MEIENILLNYAQYGIEISRCRHKVHTHTHTQKYKNKTNKKVDSKKTNWT